MNRTNKGLMANTDRRLGILKKINQVREKMHDRIKIDEDVIFDDETVKISQHLDELINEYLKYSGGCQRDGKAQKS